MLSCGVSSQVVKTGAASTPQEVFQLKVAVWAMGHIGLSSDGAGFLSCEGVLRSLTHLAATCPVYSVRGVCFHALCLVATTKEGVNQLRKYGESASLSTGLSASSRASHSRRMLPNIHRCVEEKSVYLEFFFK